MRTRKKTLRSPRFQVMIFSLTMTLKNDFVILKTRTKKIKKKFRNRIDVLFSDTKALRTLISLFGMERPSGLNMLVLT